MILGSWRGGDRREGIVLAIRGRRCPEPALRKVSEGLDRLSLAPSRA